MPDDAADATLPLPASETGPGIGRLLPLRVLLATDGSRSAATAGQFLAALPLPADSRVEVLTVTDGEWESSELLLAAEQQESERIARETAESLARLEVEVSARVRFGDRAHEIIQEAEEFDADLVVLGTQGLTGLAGFLLGSVAQNVAKHARRPVLVARGSGSVIRRVVLALDSSEHAVRAAEFLAAFPLPPETEITVVNVARPYDPYPGLAPDDPYAFQREVEGVRRHRREAGEKIVTAARRELEVKGLTVDTRVEVGDPAAEVMKVAEARHADLIVAGARGGSLIPGLVMGSVADRLLKSARCPVLLVR